MTREASTQDHTAEALDLLAQGVADLTTTERWSDWLTTAAKFHRYSFGNQMLIALQRPGATRVAGYRAWQGLGRQVRKGEKGIRILAPMTSRIKIEDPETGEEVVLTGRTRFRTVSVFDISQTDGDDLPEVAQLLAGDAPAALWEGLVTFAGEISCTVEVGPAGGANGYFQPSERRIMVEAERSELQRVKTLAHELGHALLHGGDDRGTIPRELRELEAESVAFVVLAAQGLDSGDYSFGYLAAWQGGGDEAVKSLKSSAGRIREAAARVIDALQGATSETSSDLVEVA